MVNKSTLICFLAVALVSLVSVASSETTMPIREQITEAWKIAEQEVTQALTKYYDFFNSDSESAPLTSSLHPIVKDLQDVHPDYYGSPTRAPTYSPSFVTFCATVVGPVYNQTSDQMCSTCLNAGCTWCNSGDYCFANINSNSNSNMCSSWVSGSGGACSLDLTALAALIIIIIVLAVVLPIFCLGTVGVLFCCGLCCFAKQVAYPTNTPPQTNPMIVQQPAQVVQGQVVQAQVVGTQMVSPIAVPAVAHPDLENKY
jgi:hypothetical protein